MSDDRTAAYFDAYQTWYHPRRYADVVEIVNRYAREGDTLIDVGCGDGTALQFIRNNTRIGKVSAMDVSQNYLARATARLGCEGFLGSILDDRFVASIGKKFDFVIMGEVLHHLVGRTRRQSRGYAKRAIVSCISLLRDGGYLTVFEQAMHPSFAMTVVFYIKTLVSLFTPRRLELFAHWANLGPPVVSYYTNKQLLAIIEEAARGEVVDIRIREQHLERGMRFAFIARETLTTVALRKRRSVRVR